MAIARPQLIPSCTALVSTHMVKVGALAPRTRYLGRQVAVDSEGNVVSGVVRTLCSFLTASGFERELEVPVIIHEGRMLDPSLAMIQGAPRVISAELIQSISNAGTIMDRPHLGSMYSTAYVEDPAIYRELADSLQQIPRLYRPLF